MKYTAIRVSTNPYSRMFYTVTIVAYIAPFRNFSLSTISSKMLSTISSNDDTLK